MKQIEKFPKATFDVMDVVCEMTNPFSMYETNHSRGFDWSRFVSRSAHQNSNKKFLT
jgi:hypothetical protein